MSTAAVLYVIHQRDHSGAEAFAAPVMRADPHALLACPPGSRTEAWARTLGVPTVALPHRTLRRSGGRRQTLGSVWRGLASARDLRRVLRAHPERRIVYCTSLRPALLATVARIGLRRRTLWVVTDFLPPGLLGRLVHLLAIASCDRAAATSRTVEANFVRGSRRLGRRTRVVYPGVDAARFATVAGPVDQQPVRVAVAGSISPTKRTDLALEVAVLVPERFELHILGRAQFREEDFALERRLHERVAGDERLRGRVRFAGYVEDLADRLASYRVLLHCRPDEPFGIVLTEAMAAGLAVVAPAAAGPAEIVQDGVSGLLFPVDDAAAAAVLVRRLVNEPEVARRMGEAGRRRVRELFSVQGQLDGFAALLGELQSEV